MKNREKGEVMANASELISIITPAFNAESFIGRAVQSVIEQTHPNWELLIVSDDLKDYQQILTEQEISDPRIRFISTGRIGVGVNSARTLGLNEAKGNFITTLDADDSFMPKRLELMLPYAKRYGMAGDNVSVVNHQSGELIETLFEAEKGIFWMSTACYCETDIPMTFLFHRSLVNTPWQTDVEYGEDTLFNLRLMEQVDRNVPVLSKCLHRYHFRKNSMWHSPDSAQKAEQGYQRSLSKLRGEGLGFEHSGLKKQVADMLERKIQANKAYLKAQTPTYRGSSKQPPSPQACFH